MKLSWLAVLLAVATAARAESISFIGGDSVDNATILGARDGVLYYEVDGNRYRRRLAEVTEISRIDNRRDPENEVRLISFNRYQPPPGSRNRQTGSRVLTMSLTNATARIREPLVRVFVAEQGDRGERQVRIYQSNRKVSDPTMIADLPMVDGKVYQRISYLVPGDQPVAWRVEVWIDGTLKVAQSLGAADAADNWWRLADSPRRGSLDVVEEPKEAPPEEKAAPEDEQEDSPVSAMITQARIRPVLTGDANAVFSVQYQLRSTKVNQAELPRVELYYVTEGANRRREVKHVSIDQGADRTVDLGQGGGISRTAEYTFPPNVEINAADTHLNSDKSAKVALIFWRVEIGYRDTPLAVKQGGSDKARRSLPEDWWK